MIKRANTEELLQEALQATERMNESNNNLQKNMSADNSKLYGYIAKGIVGALALIAVTGTAAAAAAILKR